MTESTPEKNDNKRLGPGYLETLLIAGLISAAVGLFALGYYDRHYAHKIFVVDLQGYTEVQRDKLLAGEIDEAGLRAAFEAVEATLGRVPDNHVVLLKEVVIGNAEQVEIKP